MNRKKIFFLDLIVGASLLLTAGTVSLSSFLISKGEYAEYEEEYNREVEELEKQKPAAPKEIFINNNYVLYDAYQDFVTGSISSYRNIKTIRSTEATFVGNANGDSIRYEFYSGTSSLGKCVAGFDNAGGGDLIFTINTKEYSDGDIDLVLASANWDGSGNSPTYDLGQYIDIIFDDIYIDMGNIDLPNNDKNNWYEFQHLILKDIHFKKGMNKLIIRTKTDAPKTLMPNISHIHTLIEGEYEDELTVNGDTMLLLSRNNKTFLAFMGQCSGFESHSISMDLRYDGGNITVIPNGAMSITKNNNNFLILIDLTVLPKDTFYSHFYLDGNLYNSGRKEGDILTKSFADKYNDWNNPVILQSLNGYDLICRSVQMDVKCN